MDETQILDEIQAMRPDAEVPFAVNQILEGATRSVEYVSRTWRQALPPHWHYEATSPRDDNDVPVGVTVKTTLDFEVLGAHPEWGSVTFTDRGYSLTHVLLTNTVKDFRG